jgi:hypothetical protein
MTYNNYNDFSQKKSKMLVIHTCILSCSVFSFFFIGVGGGKESPLFIASCICFRCIIVSFDSSINTEDISFVCKYC